MFAYKESLSFIYIRDVLQPKVIIYHKYFLCYFCFANLCVTWLLSVQHANTLMCLCKLFWACCHVRD